MCSKYSIDFGLDDFEIVRYWAFKEEFFRMDTENTIHRPRVKTRPSMEVVMMRHVLMTVGALLCVGLASAQAHENRQVGGYTLTAGFRVEPAFEDVVNAIDIFVNRTSVFNRP